MSIVLFWFQFWRLALLPRPAAPVDPRPPGPGPTVVSLADWRRRHPRGTAA
jgi:hypothetical protein